MYYNIQLRQDTLQNWEVNHDVILKRGEPALVSTNNDSTYDAYKIGDGETTFGELPLFYFIETDEYHNPVIKNPTDGEPINIAYIVDVVTLKQLFVSSELMAYLDEIDNTKGATNLDLEHLFMVHDVQLEDGRTYAIPYDRGWFGRVVKVENTYTINLFKSFENSHTIQVDIVATYNRSTHLYNSRLVAIIQPFIYYLDPASSSYNLNSLRNLINSSSEGKKAFSIAYNGRLYNSFRIGTNQEVILLSYDSVSDYYGSISYLTLTVTTVTDGGISTYNRFIRLTDDILTDFWLVKLPDTFSTLQKGQTYSVEDIWGSLDAFQNWKHNLDPQNQGISVWDVLSLGVQSRRGTMGMTTEVIDGVTIHEYYITLLEEADLGVYLNRYKIYNNPENNTVPIGDVVVYIDRYNITNPEYNRIWSDWGINDPEDLGYVRNRTHWIEPSETPGEDPTFHPLDQRFIPELTDQYMTEEEEEDMIDYLTDAPPKYRYRKVTEITPGKAYLIVVSGTAAADPIAPEDAYGYISTFGVTDKNGKITLLSNEFEFKVELVGDPEDPDGFTIRQKDGRYLYQVEQYNSFSVSDEEPESGHLWNFEYDPELQKFIITNVEFDRYWQYRLTYRSFGSYPEEQEDMVLPTLYERIGEDPEPVPSKEVVFEVNPSEEQIWNSETNQEYGVGYYSET